LVLATWICGLSEFYFRAAYATQLMRPNLITAACVMYGVTTSIGISEILIGTRFVKVLNKRRPNWIKEIDYVYLLLGAAGIVGLLGRMPHVLSEDFRTMSIYAPLILTTAIAIRLIKTRAEIGKWNEII
jgi:hypothetical protein